MKIKAKKEQIKENKKKLEYLENNLAIIEYNIDILENILSNIRIDLNITKNFEGEKEILKRLEEEIARVDIIYKEINSLKSNIDKMQHELKDEFNVFKLIKNILKG